MPKGKAFVRPVTDLFHWPINGEKYERITKSAALMCAEDLRPLSIVNGAGFRKFCKELNPAYKVPSHTTLHNYLMKMYNEEKSALVKLFDVNTSGVAFTTDLWTSTALHGYITVTAHYITDEWEMKTAMLATRRVEERHTGRTLGRFSREFNQNLTSKLSQLLQLTMLAICKWLHERQTIQMLVVFLILCS